MFLAGIKFGIGFWLSSYVAIVLIMVASYLISYVGSHFDKAQKGVATLRRFRAKDILWVSAPESDLEIEHSGFEKRPVVKTVIRWRDSGSRKEPQYRN